jgi:O-antigen ligase
MISSDKLRTYLYWILVSEVCLISISIAAASVLLGLIFIAVILLAFKEKKWPLPRTSLDAAFLAYVIIEFVTAANSDLPFDALRNAKRLLLIIIVYGVIISFTSQEKMRNAVMLLAGAVALLSVSEMATYFYEGIERLYVFQHYMTTGGLKMIVALMLIPFILSDDMQKKERLYYFIVFVPTFIALLLTNTRSAWMGFIAGVLVMSFVQYRKLFGILIAAVILFFSFAPEHQVLRAKSIVDPANSTNIGRLNMWSTGLKMWQDKPILGFGDIDLYKTYLTYRTPTGDEPAGHLHNNYVHLLVTLGAVGLAVVLFLFVKILMTEYSTFSAFKQQPLTCNIALGALAVFSGFMVNGIFEWNFGDHEIMVFVWFSVGLCLAVKKMSEEVTA